MAEESWPAPGFFLPAVSEWTPPRLEAGIQATSTLHFMPTPPPPIIKAAFDHNFFLEADMLNVEIPAALLAENALKLNKSIPCDISNECVILGPR